MQLAPHYGSEPILTLDGDPASIAVPAIRQLRRLAATLATFTDEQWAHPSRCEGWTTRDVILHLTPTNSYWALSVGAGLRGEPTRFLGTFDPVASPAQMVAAASPASNAEVLAAYTASVDTWAGVLASVTGDQWNAPAEAPPGHISVSAVAHHALWDSWVHERDIMLPLGLPTDEQPDEVAACLRYAAALGPALAACHGRTDQGVLAVEPTGCTATPFEVAVTDRVRVRPRGDTATVPAADLVLAGDSVQLLEAFSVRAPLPELPPTATWLVNGLRETFDALPG